MDSHHTPVQMQLKHAHLFGTSSLACLHNNFIFSIKNVLEIFYLPFELKVARDYPVPCITSNKEAALPPSALEPPLRLIYYGAANPYPDPRALPYKLLSLSALDPALPLDRDLSIADP